MRLQLPKCKITAVIGPVASGKTHLIKEWLRNENRVTTFDVTGEFVADESFTRVFASPRQYATILKGTPYYFRIAYEPSSDLEEDFYWVLTALWVTPSDKLLVVDEFHELCPVNAANSDVKKMLRYARHDKLGFLGVSQRIADVHKLFTSSCRMVVLFRTRDARDYDAVKDRWGKKCANMVANLRPLIYDDVAKVTHQVPQAVVVELGKDPVVFDFASDSFVAGNTAEPELDPNSYADHEPEEEEDPEEDPEVDENEQPQ
jgi:DNA helicase HerA-like ATPase